MKDKDFKQGVLFCGGNAKLFDTNMKKKTFKDLFLGVSYSNVKEFCDALEHFSNISGLSYKKILIDYMLVTKKELRNRFHSEASACIAVCGSSSDFRWKKNELADILASWSSENCSSLDLCSILAPHFSMKEKDKDLKLLFFRTKKEYANVNNKSEAVTGKKVLPVAYKGF